MVPNPRVAQFARVELIGWTLPIDDTSFRIYVAGRVKNSGDIGRMRSKFNGKFWWDMTEQEHQQFPGDYEAQVGQGPVTLHSEDRDRGILMIRRMLGDQLETPRAAIRSAPVRSTRHSGALRRRTQRIGEIRPHMSPVGFHPGAAQRRTAHPPYRHAASGHGRPRPRRPRRAAPICVIYITDAWQKTGQKPAE